MDDPRWRISLRSEKLQLPTMGTGDVGLSVFHPLYLDDALSLRVKLPAEILIVGLDTVHSVAEQHQRVEDDQSRCLTDAQLGEQRKQLEQKSHMLLSGSEDDVIQALVDTLKLLRRGGVLTGCAIRSLIGAGALLENALPDAVQGASYDLHLGDEIWCQGSFVTLTEQKPSFPIPPYSYAIAKARETAAMPSFIVGRFDLSVTGFFDGLILSNGPQVDPGYSGALFCLLFNGNSTERGLVRGKHFATIEFSTVSEVTDRYVGRHQGKVQLSDFISSGSAVGPGGKIVATIQDIERNWVNWKRWLRQAGLAFLGLLVVLLVAIIQIGSSLIDRIDQRIERESPAGAPEGRTEQPGPRKKKGDEAQRQEGTNIGGQRDEPGETPPSTDPNGLKREENQRDNGEE